jgi:glucose/arabinose dehydrogenase
MAAITRCAIVIAATLLLAAPARAGTVSDPGFTDTAVATGLSQPTALAFLPDGRMLVTQKTGALVLVDGQTKTTLITLTVCSGSEMGLLGVAVDPDFASNGFVYLYRTKPGAGGCSTSSGRFNQVVRVTLNAGTVNPASLVELLSGIRTNNGNHDAGTVRIGPDDKLWVSVGDTGAGDVNGAPGTSTNPYAQDLGALEGKVLRLELDGSPAAGNPFLATPGARGEVYALGFRNPFRMGFDPQTGRLWIGDVGQNNFEELNIVQAAGNYSWPRCEGTEPPGCMLAGDVAPIYTYSTGGTMGRSVIGGDFARAGFGPYEGQYFFGDNAASNIYRATVNAARDDVTSVQTFVSSAGGPADIVFGPGPALYYTAINTGEVRQVVARYPRPGGGTPFVVALAPAYLPCTAPNSTHVSPLANPSCTPPAQQSATLTTGTAGRGAASTRLSALPGDAGTPADEADVQVALNATDVRCRVLSPACPAGAGSDYGGRIAGTYGIRLTDTFNGRLQSLPGTMQNAFWYLPAQCTPSADPAAGSSCAASTTLDTLVPGSIREGGRTIAALYRVTVNDAGPNGTGYGAGCPMSCGDGDENVFLRSSLFTP